MSSARFPGFVYSWVYFHVSIFLSLANAECSLGFNASSKGKADTEDCMFFFPGGKTSFNLSSSRFLPHGEND